jgi:hypothetical protein
MKIVISNHCIIYASFNNQSEGFYSQPIQQNLKFFIKFQWTEGQTKVG